MGFHSLTKEIISQNTPDVNTLVLNKALLTGQRGGVSATTEVSEVYTGQGGDSISESPSLFNVPVLQKGFSEDGSIWACSVKNNFDTDFPAKRKTDDDDLKNILSEPELGDNWVKTSRATKDQLEMRHIRGRGARMELVSLGQASGDDVAGLFREIVDYYSNTQLIFERLLDGGEHEKGDKVGIPTKSRWNFRERSWYQSKYWQLKHAMKAYRRVVMITLTYDPAILKKCIEAENDGAGYRGDIYGYAMARVWSDVKRFNDRLRRYREREYLAKRLKKYDEHLKLAMARGELDMSGYRDMMLYYRRKIKIDMAHLKTVWNYIGAVLEDHKSGLPHIHLVYQGAWVAPIENMVNYWGMSQPQGVDIKSSEHFGDKFRPERYLSGYFRKALKAIDGENVNLFYAYSYFYSVRLFNVSHRLPTVPKAEKAKEWLCIGTAYTKGTEWHEGIPFSLFGKYRGYDEIEDYLWYLDQDTRGDPVMVG